MNKKQYEETFDRLDKYVFSRDMAVKDDWYYLLNYHQQQLQVYKEKLEEIREYVEHNDFSDWHIGQDKDQFRKNDILQILNEGGK